MILRYSSQFLFVLGCLALSALFCTAAFSQTPTGSEPSDLGSMSLEDLMSIEVTSVSKKPQKLSDAAAAVYVITQDEIRRSGLTSIPELLRLVPGLEVANIDSQRWAITSRGFNSRYSNKLLVLIDGRSVYTPLYSGVWWDVQDLVLDDIDRIEVIRGPGASLWGANAVNGIINIITKDSSETQGTSINAFAGEQANSIVYGGRSGTNGHFRMYAKNKAENGFMEASGTRACDAWSQSRGGFRFDSGQPGTSGMTIQGDVYDGEGDILMIDNVLAPPYLVPFAGDVKLNGANLLGRWNKTSAAGSESALQLYYEQGYRSDVQHVETRRTYDLDFQQQLPVKGRHDAMWGLGYRQSTSDTGVTEFSYFGNGHEVTALASAFIQDQITIKPDRTTLIVGSKLEHNTYTGFEIQPSVRMLWTHPNRGVVWAAVSRAVRTPSEGERNGWLSFQSMPSSTPLPQLVTLNGNPDFKPENLLAYEIGYRTEPTAKFSMDVAAFYNVYDNLRTLELGTPGLVTTPVPHIEVPLIWDNKMSGTSCGLEVAANWRPRQNWKLTLGYSYLNVSTHLDPDSTATAVPEGYEYNTPNNQVSLRSYFNLPGNREFDAMLYSVGGFKHHTVPGYVRLDLRYGWRLKNGMELSLVGQNLLEDQHQEFYGVLNETATEVPRAFYVKLNKAW